MSPDSFFALLGALEQFKMAKASLLVDPTLVLSVLQKLCLAVNKTSLLDTKAALLAESTKLLTLWPGFWNTSKVATAAAGWALDASSVTDAFAAILPDPSAAASMFGAAASASAALAAKPPAESLLAVMSSLGGLAALGAGDGLSVGGFSAMLGAYTSLLAAVKKAA